MSEKLYREGEDKVYGIADRSSLTSGDLKRIRSTVYWETTASPPSHRASKAILDNGVLYLVNEMEDFFLA